MTTQKDIQLILSEVVKRLNEHGRRIRLLEERNMAMDTRMSSSEEAILRNSQNLREEINKILKQISELEPRILKIENDIKKLSHDMVRTAKKTELLELENLIDLYNPLRSKFVTKEEVKRMIKRQ